jgi:hypothetical protein
LILAATAFVLLAGCRPAAPEYVPSATLRDLMASVVEPSADVLFASVATIVTASGTEHRFPRTDEEWQEVRARAITLVECANLLLVPGRPIAKPGETADNAEFENQPQEIEAMISRDRAAFETRVREFRQAAMTSLAAIEAKDVRALEESGDGLDKACEACHETYWYREGT